MKTQFVPSRISQVLLASALALTVAPSADAQMSPGRTAIIAAKYALQKNNDRKTALAQFKRAATFPDTQAEGTVGAVRLHLEAKNFAEAEQLLKTFLSDVNPFHVDVRLANAEFFEAKGDHAAALKELEIVSNLRPNHPDVFKRRGHVYFHTKEWDKSIENFNNYLKENPSDQESRLRRAQAYLIQNQHKLALPDLKSLSEDRPNSLEVQAMYADALQKSGEFENAEKTLRFAMKLNSNSVETNERLGDVLWKLKKTDEAATFYKRAIELDPTRLDIGQKLSKLYLETKQVKLAEDELARQLSLNPAYEPAAQEIVGLWQSQNRTDRVGSFLKSYTEKYPDKTWAVVKYAQLLVGIQQFGLAETVVDRNLKATGDNLELMLLSASIKARAGKKDDAVDVLRTAEKRFPEQPQVKFNLALLYEDLGKVERAVTKYKEIPESAPVHHKARVNLALVYEKQGNIPDALSTLKDIKAEGDLGAMVKSKITQLEKALRELEEGRAPGSSGN